MKSDLSTVLLPSGTELAAALSRKTAPKFARLNAAFGTLVSAAKSSHYTQQQAITNTYPPQLDDYNMVSFVPLDPTDEDAVAYALGIVDHAVQFGEDQEPKGESQCPGIPRWP